MLLQHFLLRCWNGIQGWHYSSFGNSSRWIVSIVLLNHVDMFRVLWFVNIIFLTSTKITIKYLFVDDLRSMIDVTGHIAEIHKKNARSNARDYKLCQQNANLCKLLVIAIPWIYCIAALTFQFPSFLDYFTKGIIRPSCYIYFPGVDESNAIHMRLLMLFNVSVSIIETSQISPSDTFIAINFSTIPLLSKIVRRKISELNDNKNGGDSMRIKKQQIEIILMQEKYNE